MTSHDRMTVSSVVLFNDIIIFSVLFAIPFLKMSNVRRAYLTNTDHQTNIFK